MGGVKLRNEKHQSLIFLFWRKIFIIRRGMILLSRAKRFQNFVYCVMKCDCVKYDIKKIMEREGLRVTLLCVSSRWIANETGGSSKVVEQWDLEIYALILLWRYVRTGGKKKQNRNRETFVSEAADISKNLTYNGGPPSKTFTYDDGFGGPFLDHPLAQTRRFLRFKRIL